MIRESVKNRILEITKGKDFRKNPAFYLYDLNSIKERLSILEENLPKNVILYYAMKANPHEEVVSFLSEQAECDGIEISSIGELKKALKYFTPENICFTGPGKIDYELEEAVDNTIGLISVESVVESCRINNLCEKGSKCMNVLVRINSDFLIEKASGKMTGHSTKFGIDEKSIVKALRKLQKFKNINIKGFHVFGASGVLDYKSLIDYVDYVFNLVKRIENEVDIRAEVIDLGGGFGIDYSGDDEEFNVKEYSNALRELIQEYDLTDRMLLLELGRYIVADSGYYVCKVVDIKECKGKKYIIASGGTNHFARPYLIGENHPISVINRDESVDCENLPVVENEKVDIGGPLCFTEDKIGEEVFIESAEIGDLLVVTKTGAYGRSEGLLEFLSHPHPPEIYERFD